MVCIGKNIANCSKPPQFLPVMCALCPRCAHTPPGGMVEHSSFLLDEVLLSLQCTQGLVLWAALQAQWKLRCEAKYSIGQ